MNILEELKPTKWQRVIDLAELAGIDISDWSNYKGGKLRPGANPKYCYEWALVKPNKFVLLNLWYENLRHTGEEIEQCLNIREAGERENSSSPRKARHARAEEAIKLAYKFSLPIRVIILTANSKISPNFDGRQAQAQVKARLLDPVSWSVYSFGEQTGEIVLRRGKLSVTYVDQRSLQHPPNGKVTSHPAIVLVRDRSADIRNFVLNRAKGKCELCGAAGFRKS